MKLIDLPSTLDDCKEHILAWLDDEGIEALDKEALKNLITTGQIDLVRDCFYRELEFGTGGLRGIMGPGRNRLNIYTVRRVAQGFAHYILRCGKTAAEQGVVIAYDSRHDSDKFAHEAAAVLCANGVPVFFFDTVQTTPMLSYAIRKIQATGGLCFTASHNPPQYNGVKVYWQDGAQIIAPQDMGILKDVLAIKKFSQVQYASLEKATQAGLFRQVPPFVLSGYIKDIVQLKTQLGKTTPKNPACAPLIVYTPLHGTGKNPALQALAAWGLNTVHVVPEQAEPDGRFPTVTKPNPEEPAALKLAIQHAKALQADMVCATDPDADRLALAIRADAFLCKIFEHQCQDGYVLLNGNQTGALLLDSLLKDMTQAQLLTAQHRVISTIVTSNLIERICTHYGVTLCKTLTGFKWIAGLISHWEQYKKPETFLFGLEESYGYMPPNGVRDKDGIAALCLAADMVWEMKQEHKNPCEALLDLFARHGAWQESLLNIDLYGEQGLVHMCNLMAHFRAHPPAQWYGIDVVHTQDFLLPHPNMPLSDVLQWELKDGSTVSARPSGTEPKLKFYISACVEGPDAATCYTQAVANVCHITQDVKAYVTRYLEEHAASKPQS